MIETYTQEVMRKRRAARIFWLIVCIFTGFLYFFFQGYYPDIRFSIRSFLRGSGGVEIGQSGELVKSFGIINVNISPKNTTMLLGSGTYTNGSKLMTDYGEYTLSFDAPNYLSGSLAFMIDRETPFYIDDIVLVPEPAYHEYSGAVDSIVRIADDQFLALQWGKTTLYDTDFSSGEVIATNDLRSIGDGYFLSGNTIVSYNTELQSWTPDTRKDVRTWIKSCPDIRHEYGYLTCPSNHTLFSEKWKTLTGVMSIGDDYIALSGSLLTNGADNTDSISLSGVSVGPGVFVHNGAHWYAIQTGALVSIIASDPMPMIQSGLDTIDHVEWIRKDLVFIGTYHDKKYLTIWDPKYPERIKRIEFPDRDLTELRLQEINGNLWIKTASMLLLLYHGTDTLHWIVDGDMIGFGPTWALYRQDGAVWEASWLWE